MLLLFKVPNPLIKLIMSCVASPSISVLLNGCQLDPLLPSRGIRQGDPLSPYLFIMCMEMLSFLIEDKCSSQLWDPFKVSRSGIAFSHLMFVDDLMLFAKADLKNCASIKDVLDSFCEMSGQKVSLAKSRVYFSPNVSPHTREELCEVLGFRSTPNLGYYLGFPIKHPGSLSQDFDFIIQRVQGKLAGWKASLLSMVDRVVLAQAVTTAVPAYVMQGVLLPARVHNKLDKLSRDFIWGSSIEKRKLHLVSWEKVVRLKENGGLGIRAAKQKNLSLTAKLCWRFKNSKGEPWAETLKRKYVRQGRNDRKNFSRTWAAIKKSESLV